jgi:hypothetical protein
MDTGLVLTPGRAIKLQTLLNEAGWDGESFDMLLQDGVPLRHFRHVIAGRSTIWPSTSRAGRSQSSCALCHVHL